MSDYIPTTEEVRNAVWLLKHLDTPLALPDEAGFDRWLAEVKAERDKHIISLIKKDCEHAKFGDPCFHDYIIDEIEAQLNRQGEEQ